MTCHEMQQWLSAYVDGQLQEHQRSQLEAHLAICATCQAELASLRSMLQTLHSLKQPQAPDLLPGIHTQLARKPVWQRLAQRFLAPWPQSLPWHGLALAMSAMLVIVVTNLPTRGMYQSKDQKLANGRSFRAATRTSVVDRLVASTSPASATGNIRQLAKASELDELRSDEGKVDKHLPEAPASVPAPVGGARFTAATGDASTMQLAVGGENLRAKKEASPVGSLKVAPEDQICNVDSDCIIVPTQCGGCECGSPVNRAFEQRYIERYSAMCKDYPGSVCGYLCPTPFVRCFDHRCALSASKPTEE